MSLLMLVVIYLVHSCKNASDYVCMHFVRVMLCVVQNWLERALCFYPPDIATDDNLPPHLVDMLDQNGMMLVTVFIEHMQVSQLL